MSKSHIIVIEPDRTIADCIKTELERRNYSVSLATSATEAVELADETMPVAVITELSLAGHSGSEFLYEFRTYPDWLEVPIVVYSSMKPRDVILQSHDWKSLAVTEFLYKPDVTLQNLADTIDSLV